MNNLRLFGIATAAMLLMNLNGCGNDDDASPSPSPTAATPAVVNEFVSSYKAAALSVKGVSDPAFADLVDDAYLDGGYTKAKLKADVALDIASTQGATPEIDADSTFPLIAIESAALGTCDSGGVCLLTVNYANPAPDLTKSVDVVQVKVSNGKMRLYGDQKAS
jgi:hypothetical protein